MQLFKKFNLFLMVLSLAVMVSCAVDNGTDSDDNNNKASGYLLSGYWKSTYGDGFEISGTTFTQYADGSKAIMFAGDVVKFVSETETSGRCVIKITDDGVYDSYTVGEYLVARFNNYTGTGVAESTPYLNGKDCDGLATADAAEAEYTDANGYFSFYGDYVKQ